jgi:Flp pilus assembly protein TadG
VGRVTLPLQRQPARGWDEGATAVEAALIISVLVFLIYGIIEFGITLWNWNTMVLAVGDAGRYVMVKYASGSSCDTTCAVGQMQTTLATAPGAVSTTCTTPNADQICLSASTTAGTPSTMTLTAAYGFKVIGLSPTYTLTSAATFPLE